LFEKRAFVALRDFEVAAPEHEESIGASVVFDAIVSGPSEPFPNPCNSIAY
jgi:hypothetical protein